MSFDVCSLFTNVPLEETIKIVADHLYSDKAVVTPSFEKQSFISLLKLATGGLFMYQDMLFQQTDGVSMGNPLAPTLANFFLADIESKIFSQHKDFYPSLFLRYVSGLEEFFQRSKFSTPESVLHFRGIHWVAYTLS